MERICTRARCTQTAVSGSPYCDDHQLEELVKTSRPKTGTLADLVRKAKEKGLIAPAVGSYHN